MPVFEPNSFPHRPTTWDFIHARNMDGLFEYVEKNVELAPVCIPSYKFRKEAKLVRNNPFSSKVYVFVYEDDFVESGYDKYDGYKGDIEFVKISKKDFEDNGFTWRGIAPKRAFIQRYMRKLGIKKYFMIDDDISTRISYSYKKRDNACGSCQMKNSTLENAMKIAQMVGEEHPEYKQIGFPFTQLTSQFFDFQKDIEEKCICGVMYFNDMPEGIEFKNTFTSSEDYDFFFTCRENGVKCGSVPYITVFFGFGNTSTHNNETIPLNDYIAHPGFIDLKVTIHDLLRSTINYVRIKHNHPKPVDEKLMELCKAGDVAAVKAYVPHLKSRRKMPTKVQ